MFSIPFGQTKKKNQYLISCDVITLYLLRHCNTCLFQSGRIQKVFAYGIRNTAQGIWNPRNFCLWIPEYRPSEIRNTVQGIRNPTNYWNPESSTCNPESTATNPDCLGFLWADNILTKKIKHWRKKRWFEYQFLHMHSLLLVHAMHTCAWHQGMHSHKKNRRLD